MGRGYVIEHCISTLNYMRQEEAYKAYETEILRAIAKRLGVDIPISFNEYLEEMKPKKEETRTAEEVIEDLKLKVNKVRGDSVEST